MTPDKDENKVEEVKAEIIEYKADIGVPTGGMLRLADSVDAILEDWKAYLDLVGKLLDKNDVLKIGDKMYKKKSAWRKLAKAFNLTDRIIREEIVRDENDQIIRATYVVECIAPNNRRTIGVGTMHKSERKFAHIEHDLPAMAHVRGKNRAISDMVGAGEASAEELSGARNDDEYFEKDKPNSTSTPMGGYPKTATTQPQDPNLPVEIVLKNSQMAKLNELKVLGDNLVIVNAFCATNQSESGVAGLTNAQRAELIDKLEGKHFQKGGKF